MDWKNSKTLFDTVFDRVKIQETFTDESGNQEIVERVPSLTRLLYVADISYGNDSGDGGESQDQQRGASSASTSSPTKEGGEETAANSGTPSSISPSPTPSSPSATSGRPTPSSTAGRKNFDFSERAAGSPENGSRLAQSHSQTNTASAPSASLVSYAHERVMDIHKTFIQQSASDPEEAENIVRGLMLLQNQTILHIVEAAPEIINNLFEHLQTYAQGEGSCILRNIRIIGKIEDCQRPLFPRPLFHVVQIGGGSKLDLDNAEDIVPHCNDLFSRMLQIGKKCPDERESQSSVNQFLDNLTSEFSDTLPPDKLVLEFARCNQVRFTAVSFGVPTAFTVTMVLSAGAINWRIP
eukprot:gb/GECG01016204.1/.p1 GENE.gb/GECG01016204.1/~~gb/GECG01016204.1/.p1  ORF type:complete len:353 (+),score=52.80 gb/GECG01016204.1/:1-1059(+)